MFVLFSSMQYYAAVSELLIFALIDKTMLRFTTTKYHQYTW